MRRGGSRLLAKAGPILRAGLLAICILPHNRAVAQADGGGWRAQLLARAAQVPANGSAEETADAVQGAIHFMDGLLAGGQNVPDHARDLADSLAMELRITEAVAYRSSGLLANTVRAYRQALERGQKVPTLAARQLVVVNLLATAQQDDGQPEAAMRTYEEAVASAAAGKDTATLRAHLVQQSLLCRTTRDFERAIGIMERVLAIDDRSGDMQNRISAYLYLSRLHEWAGSPDAYTHARTAYELAKRHDDGRLLLQACDLLINSFLATDTAQCRSILQEAIDTAAGRDRPTERATFHDRYGRFEMRLRHWDGALKQFQQGLDVLGFKLTAANDDPGAKRSKPLAELLLDMGRCLRSKADPQHALDYLLACEDVVNNGSLSFTVYPEPDLGELYLEQGQTAKAAQYGRTALARADENKEDTDLERRASLLMYKVLEKQEKYKEALAMHVRWTNAMGSRRDEDFKLGLQRKQLTESFSKKEVEFREQNLRREIESQNREKERDARTLYFVIGGLILFLGAAVVVFIDRRRRMARFEKEAAQLETQALRSQMNPHFIFNALNSINAFVQQNEPDKAASYLSRFARLMRLVLENSRQAEVPLKDDLDALDAYLHLERTRTGNKFDYRIDVAEDIDPEDVMVPPLVAQPFVENAIWHGMGGKEERGLITLSVSRRGEQLLFAIEDDGVGRNSPKRMASMGAPDPGKGGKKTSLGTAITKARLDLVRQQKGKEAGFIYVDLPQGTRVELTLPFSTAL